MAVWGWAGGEAWGRGTSQEAIAKAKANAGLHLTGLNEQMDVEERIKTSRGVQLEQWGGRCCQYQRQKTEDKIWDASVGEERTVGFVSGQMIWNMKDIQVEGSAN